MWYDTVLGVVAPEKPHCDIAMSNYQLPLS